MISRSVAQIATASMRTSTSAFFGTGTGLLVMLSWPGSPSTQARCASGIGNSLWLVFTPCGAYIESSKENFLVRCANSACDRLARSGLRARLAKFSGQSACRSRYFVAHQCDVLFARPHRRRRSADCTDDGTRLIADGRADADHAREKLLAVDRIAIA